MTWLLLVLAGCFTCQKAVAGILIIADESPVMNYFAAQLESDAKIPSLICSQTNAPDSFKSFEAVLVYIHKDLDTNIENRLIEFTRGGGKLVVLHHSISSAKRKNPHWLPFLGVDLPEKEFRAGGYKWIEGIDWKVTVLATNHFITTNKMSFAGTSGGHPCFTLKDSEVYLNHQLLPSNEPRTLLLGLEYLDKSTRTNFTQSTAGWLAPRGKGWVIYLMPGHAMPDYQNPAYRQILVNTVLWKPMN